MKKKIIFLTALLCLLFTSCKSEITLELKKDGSVKTSFTGATGPGIKKLLAAASGSKTGDVIFDTKEIQSGLVSAGFENVTVTSKGGTDLSILMTDKSKKSMLFSSGVVNTLDKKLQVVLNPQRLVNFYLDCDEEMKTYLDILIAPVFNGEVMTEREYLETLSSFFGSEVASELNNTEIVIKLINPDGKTSVHSMLLIELLTLNETITFE